MAAVSVRGISWRCDPGVLSAAIAIAAAMSGRAWIDMDYSDFGFASASCSDAVPNDPTSIQLWMPTSWGLKEHLADGIGDDRQQTVRV